MAEYAFRGGGGLTIGAKLLQLNWLLVLLLCALSGIGFAMLYSAAGGSMEPWAFRQMVRFGVGFVCMLGVALVDIRIWLRLAYAIYGLMLVLLVGVEMAGVIGMGARRWIDLGFVQLQPSELMKVALTLALARYFHGLTLEQIGRPVYLVLPVLMTLAPTGLVLRQPDLGTAIMLMGGGAVLFFAAGVRLWKFAVILGAAVAAAPVVWQFLRGYQRNRILTFLNPETDPLGAGYHILQSKIALGSGGLFGKGFMQGTQSHLNFLPEKQTDFIFTMLAEEQGIVGALGLVGLYALVIFIGMVIALRSRSHFGRLLAVGITTAFFLYMFVNVAMVMGLVPVVGAPLPLISYGGTAMLTMLFGFGLLLSADIHRDTHIPRRWRAAEQ